MVSPAYYREQARVLLEWESRADAETAKRLKARAQEFLTLADLLDPSELPPPPAQSDQPAAQQQQQIQPEADDDQD